MNARYAEQKVRGSRGRKQLSISGKVCHYRNQTFWAERGMIHVVDERDGDYKAVTIKEWIARIIAIRNEAVRTKWADEREDMQELVEHMIRVCQQAKDQGDPCRPLSAKEKEQAHKAAQQRLQEKKRVSILVPGMVTAPAEPKQLILP